jgi:predicted membrane channel-forming protein YqfA (hemolysin III family)
MTILDPVACFQKASEPAVYFSQGFTIGYCTGNLIVLTLALISLVFCCMLFTWHIKEYGFWGKKTYRIHKTWIFILMGLSMTLIAVKYLFNLSETEFYAWLLGFAQLLQSIVIYLVCHFFAIKSSSKSLDELKWVR